jgi:hypothetical protein
VRICSQQQARLAEFSTVFWPLCQVAISVTDH